MPHLLQRRELKNPIRIATVAAEVAVAAKVLEAAQDQIQDQVVVLALAIPNPNLSQNQAPLPTLNQTQNQCHK
jgi:hypothetical protein